jgi:DMSO/TMAO reductase YedYZ molybdopterin-dependent catalytic subunit
LSEAEPNCGDRPLLTRRMLLGAMSLATAPLMAAPAPPMLDPELQRLLDKLPYLTPQAKFAGFVREKPIPYEMPEDRLRDVGLTRDTWQLEVIPEDGGNAQVELPMTQAAGTALRFADLVKLGETRAVRFMKTIACTLVADPFGTGVWEGVPLRDVVWLAKPTANVRRLYYYGFHNDDPKQRFQSGLPMSRVLEEPPGELPVILCYKYNGQWLGPKLGGPVRMIVPEGYGNKCIKWLRRIVLTNNYQSNDTYAAWGNDTDSPIKTCARFIHPSRKIKLKAGQRLPIIGTALIGTSGLSRAQYSLRPKDEPLPAEDPYLAKLDWQDAQIVPPPASDWGGDYAGGKLPAIPLQFDPASGAPRSWPLRYASAQWAVMSGELPAGHYELRCRTIDASGNAQPMPRPLPRSGDNRIQVVDVSVEG